MLASENKYSGVIRVSCCECVVVCESDGEAMMSGCVPVIEFMVG